MRVSYIWREHILYNNILYLNSGGASTKGFVAVAVVVTPKPVHS